MLQRKVILELFDLGDEEFAESLLNINSGVLYITPESNTYVSKIKNVLKKNNYSYELVENADDEVPQFIVKLGDEKIKCNENEIEKYKEIYNELKENQKGAVIQYKDCWISKKDFSVVDLQLYDECVVNKQKFNNIYDAMKFVDLYTEGTKDRWDNEYLG